jgi:hypothetical protein
LKQHYDDAVVTMKRSRRAQEEPATAG